MNSNTTREEGEDLSGLKKYHFIGKYFTSGYKN
jgi:hypothetical protein